MSNVVVTYCSKDKDPRPDLLPASERYISSRTQKVTAAAKKFQKPLYFLSAKFGLITADTPIPNYDQRLTLDDADRLVALSFEAAKQLTKDAVTNIEMVVKPEDAGAAPYIILLVHTALLVDVPITVVSLERFLRNAP